MTDKEFLLGGNASGATVFRVGDTVRKPWAASTASVVAFVDALRSAGVDAPAPLGRDEAGRQVLEFIPGPLALHVGPLTRAEYARVGAMVRAVHDASRTYTAPADAVWETAMTAPGDELICHNDLAPWNLIIGERWVFIDWDAAAPSTPIWDLAYAAQAFTLSDPARDPRLAAEDLAALVTGYRADYRMRRRLPEVLSERTAAMYDLLRSSHATGEEPWASMFSAGHGEHWSAAERYVRRHQRVWSAALSTG